MAKGLTFRPLAETARDTLIWYKSLPDLRQRQTLPEQFTRYDEILAAWHEEHPNPTLH